MTARAWSYSDQREFMSLHKLLSDTLAAAQTERNKRQDLVPVAGNWPEAGWIRFERETMFGAVNRERATRGRPPVLMKDIERVERGACGHSDYSTKFALYCAEIVMGMNPNVA